MYALVVLSNCLSPPIDENILYLADYAGYWGRGTYGDFQAQLYVAWFDTWQFDKRKICLNFYARNSSAVSAPEAKAARYEAPA